MVHLVSYDLNRPGQAYERLYQLLNGLHSIRLQDSVWLVRSAYSAQVLAEHFRSAMDPNDTLVVTQYGPDAYCYLEQRVWDWLNKAA